MPRSLDHAFCTADDLVFTAAAGTSHLHIKETPARPSSMFIRRVNAATLAATNQAIRSLRRLLEEPFIFVVGD